MVKIIELSGSPGVGKTTLYKELENRWNKKCNWIPAHLLHPKAGINYTTFIKFFRNIKRVANGTQGKIGNVAFLGARKRFVAEHPEYIDTCWNDIMTIQRKSLNGQDLRFEKAQQLAEMIAGIQFLKEVKSDKTAIVEEGLIHLIDVISAYDNIEDITGIISVMPLPDAIIYIQTDVSENVRRLLNRDNTINMHKSLDANQLQQTTIQSRNRRRMINNVLQEKGVPILQIDSKEPVVTNTDKIISFLESL